MLSRRSFLLAGGAAVLTAWLSACGSSIPGLSPAVVEARSKKSRLAATTSEADLTALATALQSFSFDLFQHLRTREENLFFSPISIAEALLMTMAGARGTTAQQMRDTLHLTLEDEQLSAAVNALDTALRTPTQSEQNPGSFELKLNNQLWGQRDFHFEEAFLDQLAQTYGAGVELVDFQKQTEAARVAINQQIETDTNGKIKDLLPEGAVTQNTRLVLTNAIYFKAKWLQQFDAENTRETAPFTLLDGSAITAPQMVKQSTYAYAEDSDYQAVMLPYDGNAAMVVLLPREGQYAAFEQRLDGTLAAEIVEKLNYQEVKLSLPKFQYTAQSFSLSQTLQDLGMTDAFDGQRADFSGMTGERNLKIDDAFHQAMIQVDEAGTEAAAASAVIAGVTSAPMPEQIVTMTIDRPFIFFIRDSLHGTILFLGRMQDPRT